MFVFVTHAHKEILFVLFTYVKRTLQCGSNTKYFHIRAQTNAFLVFSMRSTLQWPDTFESLQVFSCPFFFLFPGTFFFSVFLTHTHTHIAVDQIIWSRSRSFFSLLSFCFLPFSFSFSVFLSHSHYNGPDNSNFNSLQVFPVSVFSELSHRDRKDLERGEKKDLERNNSDSQSELSHRDRKDLERVGKT